MGCKKLSYYKEEIQGNLRFFYGGALGKKGYAEKNRESSSRFGFNGQEKDNEVAGIGNSMTAQFWQYDTRLGRRWNLDPVDQIGISNYAVMANNPIAMIDPLGDSPQDKEKKGKKQTGECEDCEDIGLEDGDFVSDVQVQDYTVIVKGVTQKDFNNIKEKFIKDPSVLTNNAWATYKLIDRDGSGDASVNDHIDINIAGPDDGSVRIRQVNSTTSTFMANFVTLEGHTDAGYITFTGTYNAEANTFTFNINNTSRTNVMGSALGGASVARGAQQRQWKVVLSNIPRVMKKQPIYGGLTIEEYDYSDRNNKIGDLDFRKTRNLTKWLKYRYQSGN